MRDIGPTFAVGDGECRGIDSAVQRRARVLRRLRREAVAPPSRRRAQSQLQRPRARRRSVLTIYVYMAAPGSKAAESLSLLASWAATPEPGKPVQAPDGV